MDPLLRTAKHCLQPDRCTASEVVERVVMDCLLRALPPEERMMNDARNPQKMLDTLNRALATMELGRGEWREFPKLFPTLCTGQPYHGVKRPPHRPVYGTPQDEPMSTEPDPAAPNTKAEKTLAGRLRPTHGTFTPNSHNSSEVKWEVYLCPVGHRKYLHPSPYIPPTLPEHQPEEGTLTVTCVHGDAWEIPATQVRIQSAAGEWPVLVGLVPLLLGVLRHIDHTQAAQREAP
ncbi:uncharacterized protein LOC128318555 [Pangasianodon hypophthalmus]|uniref:uncharacterized protein LOC128318555 n=1 Tax=Pangasianodon hypophthalmus TaxID=310915 RepID=UPI0023072CA1|nr:uncharacterized protein LOC128318555 [Pangasianodon hypophthalmus]